MADTVSKSVRSRIMSSIGSRDTGPEMAVRRMLYSNGFRYRVDVGELPGRPDIVLGKYGLAVFVNGCFWHGHTECGGFRVPKTNSGFWRSKIGRNVDRDKRNLGKLLGLGWRVLVVWECSINRGLDFMAVDGFIKSDAKYMEM